MAMATSSSTSRRNRVTTIHFPMAATLVGDIASANAWQKI
jgi:hypothetical protein